MINFDFVCACVFVFARACVCVFMPMCVCVCKSNVRLLVYTLLDFHVGGGGIPRCLCHAFPEVQHNNLFSSAHAFCLCAFLGFLRFSQCLLRPCLWARAVEGHLALRVGQLWRSRPSLRSTATMCCLKAHYSRRTHITHIRCALRVISCVHGTDLCLATCSQSCLQCRIVLRVVVHRWRST